MRKLLTISIFASLLLVLTACPSTKDIVKPTVAITSSTDDVVDAANKSYKLEGTASDNVAVTALSYSYNGSEAVDILDSLENGKFSATFNLVEGEKTIVVTAKDKADNTTKVEKTIEYCPTDAATAAVDVTPVCPTNTTSAN